MIRMRPIIAISASPKARFSATIAIAVCLGLFAGNAYAQDAADEGASDGSQSGGLQPYVEYMVGISHVPNQTIKGANSSSITLWGRTESEPVGYFIGGALGARIMPGVRTELQVGFRSSNIDSLGVQAGGNQANDGFVNLLTVMANAYYDLDLSDQGIPVVPWVGAGIGWGMPRLDGQNNNMTAQLDIDDTDSIFVWNVMTGVTYPISEITELSLGYRYIVAHSPRFRGTIGGALQRFEYEFDAHEAFLGLRFNF